MDGHYCAGKGSQLPPAIVLMRSQARPCPMGMGLSPRSSEARIAPVGLCLVPEHGPCGSTRSSSFVEFAELNPPRLRQC
jgi:hypothetical protein